MTTMSVKRRLWIGFLANLMVLPVMLVTMGWSIGQADAILDDSARLTRSAQHLTSLYATLVSARGSPRPARETLTQAHAALTAVHDELKGSLAALGADARRINEDLSEETVSAEALVLAERRTLELLKSVWASYDASQRRVDDLS